METAAAQAKKIVELDRYLFGDAHIVALATFGWPKDSVLANDSFELRCEIQDEAKRIKAEL